MSFTDPSLKYTEVLHKSPKQLFVAKNESTEFNKLANPNRYYIFSAFSKTNQPLYSYNLEANHCTYIGGIASISPEALEDIANLCQAIFDADLETQKEVPATKVVFNLFPNNEKQPAEVQELAMLIGLFNCEQPAFELINWLINNLSGEYFIFTRVGNSKKTIDVQFRDEFKRVGTIEEL